jgi:hypothetical protein
MGFGCLSQDIVHKLKHGPQAAVTPAEMKNKRAYRLVVSWFLITPLIWSIPSMPGFVPLTVGTNVIVVMTIPIVAGILWYLTASSKYIGAKHKNNAWENLTMGLLFALAAYGTWQAVVSFT